MASTHEGTGWLLRALGEELDDLAARMGDHIREEIPEYGGVAEVEFNAARHVRTFLRWCFGDGDLEALLSFEQDVTAGRVETGFALLPTLGAYRIGDIELWKWTLEVIGRPNAFATVDDATELLELWSTYGE